MRDHCRDVRRAGSKAGLRCDCFSEGRLYLPVAVLEAVLGLARPDKFALAVSDVEPIVVEFLDERGIEIRDLPPPSEATSLALSAAHRYRSGRHGLNLGDCLHYACAKYFVVPILATAEEFRQTDLTTVP